MEWYWWLIAYVGMGTVEAYLHSFYYYGRTLSRLNEDEFLFVIVAFVFWPVFLPFTLVQILGMITENLVEKRQKKKTKKQMDRDLMLREREVALKERVYKLRMIEKELGMPLSPLNK